MADGDELEGGALATTAEAPAPTKVCPRCAVQQQSHGTFCAHCGSHYDSRHADGLRSWVGRHIRRWGWPFRTLLVGLAIFVVCTPAAYGLAAGFAEQINGIVSKPWLEWAGEILGLTPAPDNPFDPWLLIVFVAAVVGMVLGFALTLIGGGLTLVGMLRAVRADKRTQRAVAVSKDVGRKGLDSGRELSAKGIASGRELGGRGLEAGREVGGKSLEVGRDVGGRGLEVGRDLGTLGVALSKDVGRKGLDSGRELSAKGIASGRRRLAERRGLPVEEPSVPEASPTLPPPTGDNTALAPGDPLAP